MIRSIKVFLFVLLAGWLITSCAAPAKVGQKGYTEEGKASYYSKKFEGRKMANGERYRGGKKTAAHRTLPFGTKVKVTNLSNNKTVKVTITDRGPHIRGRIVDLSYSAARSLGLIKAGVAPVELKVIKAAKGK